MEEKISKILKNARYCLHNIKEYELKYSESNISFDIDKQLIYELSEIPLEINNLYLYKVDELIFSKKEGPRRESMENILSSFRNLQDINLVYIILGDSKKISFYLGIVPNLHLIENEPLLDFRSYANSILKPSIDGNYGGSKIELLSNNDKKLILNRIKNNAYSGILNGIPGFKSGQSGEKIDFQGVERLVDTMIGREFGFVVVANPCKDSDIIKFNTSIQKLYDKLSPLTKYTVQENTNTQTDKIKEDTHSTTKNVLVGTNFDRVTSETSSTIKGKDERTDVSHQENTNKQKSTSQLESEYLTKSESYSNPRNYAKSDLNKTSQTSISESVNKDDSNSVQYGDSTNEINTEQWSKTKTVVVSTNDSNSTNTTNSTQESNTKNTNVSNSHAYSERTSENSSNSSQVIYSLEVEKKAVVDWLKYIDDVLLNRIDLSKGKAGYTVCAYLFADKNRADLYSLANTIIGLYGGEKGNISPLRFFEITHDNPGLLDIQFCLQNLQIPILNKPSEQWASIFSKINLFDETKESIGTWLNSSELGLLMGLPRKEIIGVSIRDAVEYGVNIYDNNSNLEDNIFLGHLVHQGKVKSGNPIFLNKEVLKTHTFICGVTGTGKTTTCQNILMNSNLPFLVIEPAKTEYRALSNSINDLFYFTLGKQTVAPFFLNPFELFENESISSRVDMIKATMQSSFDMEAAMPQIIEAAAYEVYKRKGWNLKNNKWINPFTNQEENPFSTDSFAFPTLSDFIDAIEYITKEQDFGERLEAEYLGSLKARLQALTIGAKGMMLNTPRSIDFKKLVNQKVVIELEEIKDGSEKSLIMGFILTNLLEAVKYQFNMNNEFQHITLVEEAHRLLSKYELGDSTNKKHGVEVFSDMLAEVRKYGESLIIVDQIPNKMTPEVLKNTSTKIVHKIFAQDDKEAIGNTMALNDEQKSFMSYLDRGRAIIVTEGWKKPALVQINKLSNITNKLEINDVDIRNRIIDYYLLNYDNGVLPNIKSFDKSINKDIINEYLAYLEKDIFEDFRIITKFFNNLHFSKSLNGEFESNRDLEDNIIYLICQVIKYKTFYAKLIETKKINRYVDYLLGRASVLGTYDNERLLVEIIKVIVHNVISLDININLNLDNKIQNDIEDKIKNLIFNYNNH